MSNFTAHVSLSFVFCSATLGSQVDRLATLSQYKAQIAAEKAASHDWAGIVGSVGPVDLVRTLFHERIVYL